LALHLVEKLKVNFFYYTYSRLLIEPNRSLGHPQLFSEFTRKLNASSKKELLNRYYKPYREKVDKRIQCEIAGAHSVLHLSIHSFTPVLNGIKRKADLGILFDPGRKEERKFASSLKKELKKISPELKVRYNYPYLGIDDGFTSWMRKRYPDQQYLGIELEANQGLLHGQSLKKIAGKLLKALRKAYFISP